MLKNFLSINRQQIGYSSILYVPIHILITCGIFLFTNIFRFDELIGFFFMSFGSILFTLVFVQIINKLFKIDYWWTLLFFAFFVIVMESLTYLMTDMIFLSILFKAVTKPISFGQFILILAILNNYLSLIISIIAVKLILYYNSVAANTRQRKEILPSSAGQVWWVSLNEQVGGNTSNQKEDFGGKLTEQQHRYLCLADEGSISAKFVTAVGDEQLSFELFV